MIRPDEVIQIGVLKRTHGHRGEIQCLMLNDYWDNATAEFVVLRLDDILVPFRVIDWRGKGADSLIFQFQDIDSEPDAAKLIGTEVYMLRRDMTEEAEDLLTWQDLKGYQLFDQQPDGEYTPLGIVADVDESTINTLLTLEDGRLMPIHEDFIIDIDREAHVLRVNLPFEI